MSLTLQELKEKISHECDEVTILELLEIDGEMLVERFEDEIQNRYDRLLEEFENPSDQGEENPVHDTQSPEDQSLVLTKDRAIY